MLGVFGEANRHHGAPQDGRSEVVQLSQRLPQHGTVVHPRRHYDLSMKFDPLLRESAKLRDDVGGSWVSQEIAPYGRIGGVNRYVQRRQPVLDDALNVRGLQVGERGEVAV